jgi:hypothetical protein
MKTETGIPISKLRASLKGEVIGPEDPRYEDMRRACAAYVGFIGQEGDDGVRRAYPPATLKRLVQVKRRYDPENLFHLNLNIAPEMRVG